MENGMEMRMDIEEHMGKWSKMHQNAWISYGFFGFHVFL